MKLKDSFNLIGRLFLGGVFLYAGLSKILEPVENFRGVIAEYQVFPEFMIAWISYSMPWVEVVAGIFLVVGYFSRYSALLLGIFSLSFVLLITASYLKLGSLPASCGCFGNGGIHLSPSQVIFLDLFNTILGAYLFRLRPHPLSLDQFLTSK